MKNKGWLAVALVGCLALFSIGCTSQAGSGQPNGATRDKLTVAATIYPLADFAKKVGGEHVEVMTLTPPGVEPHDFEPTPRDLEKLDSSKVFIYNGAGLESWVDRVRHSLDPKKTVIVNATQSLNLLKIEEEHAHDEEEHGEEGHHHGEWDPHVWLDPVMAEQQAARIRDALIQADPDHRTEYENNYRKLSERLSELDRKFSELTRKADIKEIVVSHAAFGYLAERYGLEQIAVAGLSPMDEPSPKAMEEILHVMKEHGIRHVFFETLANVKVAEAIRKETGAEALTLHPIEGLTEDEVRRGEDYFSLMQKNLENLKKGLQVH
jgi:zinc transport system substrate-binding protein